MELQHLVLTRCGYGLNEGKFEGSASFKNQYGMVTLTLDHSLSSAILAVVSEQLVASSRTLAQELTAQCIKELPPLLCEQAE
jgi:hypothetical protein